VRNPLILIKASRIGWSSDFFAGVASIAATLPERSARR